MHVTMSNAHGGSAAQGQAGRPNGLLDNTVSTSAEWPSFCAAITRVSRKLGVLQMVHEFVGYTSKGWATALYRVLIALTGGTLLLFSHYSPTYSLWTMRRCTLSKAEYVHVKVTQSFLFTSMVISHLSLLLSLVVFNQHDCCMSLSPAYNRTACRSI